MKEYQLIADDESVFSSQMKASGYNFSIASNMLFIFCLAIVLLLVWILMALIERFLCRKDKACDSKQSTRSSTTTTRWLTEVGVNNFIVRFTYEVFFELMICAFINVSSVSGGSIFWWTFSLGVILASIVGLCVFVTLFCTNGPYIEGTYAPSSLMGSFWGVRHLHEDVIKSAELVPEHQGGKKH